jgi:hypothetical protein
MTQNQATTNEDQRIIDELREVINKAAFFVAFSKRDGEPIAAIAGKDCPVIEEGCLPIPVKVLTDLAEKRGKEYLETKNYTFNHVHGSPGCYFTSARNGYKCICCG